MEPLVIIGVPVYNGAEYLAECLDSIHKQVYTNWECCIINNQSTDETPEIGRRFEKLDPRFKLITNSTFVDMIVNFNNTVKHVSEEAEFFKVVCADDWLYPEYLSQMIPLMLKHPEAGLGLSFRIDHLRVGCTGLNIYDGPVFKGKDILLKELRGTLNVTGSETNQLYRIESLKELGNYPEIFSPESYNFDTSLAYDLLDNSDLVFGFQILSYTRRHEETFTSKYKDRFRTTLNSKEYELFRFRHTFPELEADYCATREKYGLEFFKRKIRGDKDFFEWHYKWLPPDRRFGKKEMLILLWKSILGKITRKRKGGMR